MVIIRKENWDEGKLESLDKPMRGFRNSSEDFIVVGRGKGKIFVNMMGSASSDHTATFFCLDRVITVGG